MGVDLESLYKQSQSGGLIEDQSPKSSGIDLESLYSDAKSGKLSTVDSGNSKTTAAPSEDDLHKAYMAQKFNVLSESAMRDIEAKGMPGRRALLEKAPLENTYNKIAGAQNTVKQIGTSVLLGNMAGALPAVSKLPLAGRLAVEGAAGAQAFDYGSVGQRLLGTAAGAGTGAAIGAVAKPIAKAVEAVTSGDFKLASFGGDRALRKVAIQAKQSLNSVYNKLGQEYEPIMEKLADKTIDPRPIQESIMSALDQVPDNSPAGKLLQKTFDSLDGMTAKELHGMKGRLFKQAKSLPGIEKNAVMQLYDSINELLARPSYGGDAYAAVTKKFNDFTVNEANYVKRRILDRFGNVDESKLGSKLNINEKEAFSALGKRSGRPLLRDIQALRRGRNITTTLERYGPAVLAGGGILTAAYGAGKSISRD